MTLVNYAYHTSVTDSRDWLDKLRTFAIAQGWTGSDYRTNVEWNTSSPYGWIVGDGDFLQLTSACYGSCDKANYRFYAYNYDANEDQLYCGAHDTDTYSLITQTPMYQDRWSRYTYWIGTSMPPSGTGIEKAWFFGNQYYIYAVCQYDDYMVPTWHFGSIDLYPEYQGRTDCAFFGQSNRQQGIGVDDNRDLYGWHVRDPEYWFSGLLPTGNPYTTTHGFDCVYFSGKAQNYDDDGAAYSFWEEESAASNTQTQDEAGAYNFCKKVLRTTGYSGLRPGFFVDFFAEDTGSGNIVPLGKTPFRVIPFNGLTVGESMTVNGETWLCFPFRFTWHNRGFAFRIA